MELANFQIKSILILYSFNQFPDKLTKYVFVHGFKQAINQASKHSRLSEFYKYIAELYFILEHQSPFFFRAAVYISPLVGSMTIFSVVTYKAKLF